MGVSVFVIEPREKESRSWQQSCGRRINDVFHLRGIFAQLADKSQMPFLSSMTAVLAVGYLYLRKPNETRTRFIKHDDTPSYVMIHGDARWINAEFNTVSLDLLLDSYTNIHANSPNLATPFQQRTDARTTHVRMLIELCLSLHSLQLFSERQIPPAVFGEMLTLARRKTRLLLGVSRQGCHLSCLGPETGFFSTNLLASVSLGVSLGW